MSWRLRLRREPEPVLTDGEVEFLATLLDGQITAVDALMRRRRVSESVIRARMSAESVRAKLAVVQRHQRRR